MSVSVMIEETVKWWQAETKNKKKMENKWIGKKNQR